MEKNGVEVNSLKAWILAARPKTLTGAAVPVMIGTALALADSDFHIRIVPTVLCFLFAFIMQIDANFVRDSVLNVHVHRDGSLRRLCAGRWL